MIEKNIHKIKCSVTNCRFNDDIKYLCTLKEIDISCTCNNNVCNSKKETMCNSFVEKV